MVNSNLAEGGRDNPATFGDCVLKCNKFQDSEQVNLNRNVLFSYLADTAWISVRVIEIVSNWTNETLVFVSETIKKFAGISITASRSNQLKKLSHIPEIDLLNT